ncbi:MAG TPA: translocation/assembly module TamB domain-containing protein [Casimicrobiaceae bacterium]
MRKAFLVVLALIFVAIAALVGFAFTEQGLPFIVARIVAQSGGHIAIEGPTGSIAGTMRFRRVIWRDSDITVTADDVIVDWNPGALWSSKLSIHGLGAAHVDIAIKPSSAATSPPTDLGLPLAVAIDHVGVGRIDWHTGPRGGHVTGLEFTYSGNRDLHRIDGLKVVTEAGTMAGDFDVAAHAPLAVRGRATLAGSDVLEGAELALTLSGRLDAIVVNGNGTLRGAPLSLAATATPFAAAPFGDAHVLITGFDASTFDASLPHTHATLRFDAKPAGSGLTGTLDLANDTAGPIDRGGLPVTSLRASYGYDARTLRLVELALALDGGGGATGTATVALGAASAASSNAAGANTAGTGAAAAPGFRAKLALALRNVDLARIDTRLSATRLAGTVEAEGDAATQSLSAEITDRDLAVSLRAVATPARIDVTQFSARDRRGALAGTASLTRDEAGTFGARLELRSVDPSRFLAVAPGSLGGTVDLRGHLYPEWEAAASVALARGSRYAGLAVSGTGAATVRSASIEKANVDLTVASATLRVHEASGAAKAFAFTVDVPQLADLAPIVPDTLPRPLAGSIRASGTVDVAARAPRSDERPRGTAIASGPLALVQSLSGHLTLHADGVRAGPHIAVAKADVEATLGAVGASAQTRTIALDATATRLVTPLRDFESTQVTVSGSTARHRATLAVTGSDLDLEAALTGGFVPGGTAGTLSAWHGELTSFTNKGAIPVSLGGPAAITWSPGRAEVDQLRVTSITGRANVDSFIWDHGRITTRGTLTGASVARVAALAGHPLPFESTLKVGGDWSIAASPRLNGSFHLRREDGDIYADVPASGTTAAGTTPRAFGITRLDIAGTFTDDALGAQAEFRSAFGGNATASLELASVATASPGTISPEAPLALDVDASIASLAVFQSWIGTDAVVTGRIDAVASARGTLRDPRWTGSVSGDSIRVDAARYGVALTDGRVRAHVAPTGIAVDDVSFAGGDGRFTASGNIALPGAANGARSSVRWKAGKFLVANRPDLRFVVDGEGTVVEENRRLTLAGSLRIDQGHVEYEPQPSGKLAPDIVVVGAPAREGSKDAFRNTPLALDVDVDLGPAMTFVGEGLDARLAGKVKITTAADGTLQGRGTIRTVNGTYYAFGQTLTIDRGRVIFDGALDNPALDVVALRKNLPVEAGVQVSGSAKLPLVRITSNPPVPENEALAWLVTGQGLASSGRTDYAAISAASALLLSRGGKPLTAQLAQRFGLDELSVQSAGTTGTNGVASQVVVLGKRLSDRLTLGYEQGLSIATSALRLDYALSQRVTIRAEAGTVSGVSIVYRRSFR